MATWISTRTGQFAYFDRQLGHPDWTGKRVLDFAGNVGNILLDPNCRIAPELYWSIDVSRDAIVEGRRRHPKGHFIFYDRYNFEYNPTGTVGLPVPDPGVRFDVIVGWSILTHVSKAETFELADQLAGLLPDDGRAALTFLDPWWTPPEGWVRDTESPGMSNLRWRLEARHETKPEMDVAALLARAERDELTWTTLVNDDDLIFDPDDDGLSEDKPQRAYITFCTPGYMRRLFPDAEVLPPVPPERHHCLVTDRAGLRSHGR
ncbi:MAG TPA: class I SAM-dependent methyltransferase [Nonomuraea sp.]|nr:class I SAM-dependent methyltransferase [Nonomuraea sp.]